MILKAILSTVQSGMNMVEKRTQIQCSKFEHRGDISFLFFSGPSCLAMLCEWAHVFYLLVAEASRKVLLSMFHVTLFLSVSAVCLWSRSSLLRKSPSSSSIVSLAIILQTFITHISSSFLCVYLQNCFIWNLSQRLEKNLHETIRKQMQINQLL